MASERGKDAQTITMVHPAGRRGTRVVRLCPTARTAAHCPTVCAPGVPRGDTPRGARYPQSRSTGADRGYPSCSWPPSPALYVRGAQPTTCRSADWPPLSGNPSRTSVFLWDQDTRDHLAAGDRNTRPYSWILYDPSVYRGGDTNTTTALCITKFSVPAVLRYAIPLEPIRVTSHEHTRMLGLIFGPPWCSACGDHTGGYGLGRIRPGARAKSVYQHPGGAEFPACGLCLRVRRCGD